MKKIQTFWALFLGALIGWLMPSCRCTEMPLLYGPEPYIDTVICLYGPPSMLHAPQQDDTKAAANVAEPQEEEEEK